MHNTKSHNKSKQHSPAGLDSLAVARFVHGFAIVAQNNQQQVCRCLKRSGCRKIQNPLIL
jgi:hypothetical protein